MGPGGRCGGGRRRELVPQGQTQLPQDRAAARADQTRPAAALMPTVLERGPAETLPVRRSIRRGGRAPSRLAKRRQARREVRCRRRTGCHRPYQPEMRRPAIMPMVQRSRGGGKGCGAIGTARRPLEPRRVDARAFQHHHRARGQARPQPRRNGRIRTAAIHWAAEPPRPGDRQPRPSRHLRKWITGGWYARRRTDPAAAPVADKSRRGADDGSPRRPLRPCSGRLRAAVRSPPGSGDAGASIEQDQTAAKDHRA